MKTINDIRASGLNLRKSALAIPLILVLSVLGFVACNHSQTDSMKNKPAKVKLVKEAYGYQIYVDGDPFYIKGAGFEGKDPSSVAKYGGNTIRTWRAGDQFISGKEKLDAAHENGLMVVLGLSVGLERHGFDYDDEEAVKKQLERIREDVLKYKNHPALLAWGIGNELNLRYTNRKVWDAVNEISEMIKEIDPNHLTTTMLAGARPELVRAVQEQCPSLDFLSFQLYGSINRLPEFIAQSGYTGAYVLTEWGVTGHWERPQTAWGRPIEQNSHEKALVIRERYENVIASDAYHCIGSTVFLWGQKQERTPTWYGMFLETGEKTESVDMMQYLWTDNWPQNRAPKLEQFTMNSKTAPDNIYLSPSQKIEAEVIASDPEGDSLYYRWEILPEVPLDKQSDGGDYEPRPETLFLQDSASNVLRVAAPTKAGEYRLFVYVFDGHNNAATANIPFYVK